MEEASLRSTYDSYRTAVATDNARLQATLRPALLARKQLAVSWAEKELRGATAEFDRNVAAKTLESLER